MEEQGKLNAEKEYWDDWAGSMDGSGWRYKYLRNCQRLLVSILDVKEDISVLDVGCGTGHALGMISMLINGKGLFYGIDFSHGMIEKAKENFNDQSQFHFMEADAAAIPLSDDQFDIIICSNSFHHYPDPLKALNEMQRLLKAGGKVYILDPTADTWPIKIIGSFGKLFKHSREKFYSTKEFARLITGAKLKYAGCRKIKMLQRIHMGEKEKI
ncbi:MAG: class I SAM-dependent methyltransferase [Bacteroidales bacterium]|jgi:ubiquinone/menaquinone biosynthesis C-methylase UbiE